jgi:hypothetical protein
MIFKTLVCTSKRTLYLTIKNVNLLTLFKELFDVYSEIVHNPYIQNAELTDC